MLPFHECVDWSTKQDGVVTVTCPICGATHTESSKSVAYRIRQGIFTGRCRADRKLGKTRLLFAAMSSVDYTQQRVVRGRRGVRQVKVLVTCPVCQKARWLTPSIIRIQAQRPGFSGACRDCVDRHARKSGRHLTGDGYVKLRKRGVPPSLVDWFDRIAYRSSSGHKEVLEHHLIAVSTIGRPLKRSEVVHHRNGVRNDNRPENLQVMTRREHTRLHNDLRH